MGLLRNGWSKSLYHYTNTPEGVEFVLLSELIEDYELINVVLEKKSQEEMSVDLAAL